MLLEKLNDAVDVLMPVLERSSSVQVEMVEYASDGRVKVLFPLLHVWINGNDYTLVLKPAGE